MVEDDRLGDLKMQAARLRTFTQQPWVLIQTHLGSILELRLLKLPFRLKIFLITATTVYEFES